MPRPCKNRRIQGRPNSNYFKPAGVQMSSLKQVELTLEEFESLRLIYIDNLPQEEASKKMQISQPTFSRTLKSTINKISDAIVNGKAIKIQWKY